MRASPSPSCPATARVTALHVDVLRHPGRSLAGDRSRCAAGSSTASRAGSWSCRGADRPRRARIPGRPGRPAAQLAALLAAHLRHERLEPVATFAHAPSRCPRPDKGRAIADVALDKVEVLEAGRPAGAFAELEVELVEGDDSDLERLGRALRRRGREDVGRHPEGDARPAAPPRIRR